jgi:hypothetical protein
MPSISLFTSLMRSGHRWAPVSTVSESLFMLRRRLPASHGACQHSAPLGCTRSNAQYGSYSSILIQRTTRGGGREDLGHSALVLSAYSGYIIGDVGVVMWSVQITATRQAIWLNRAAY